MKGRARDPRAASADPGRDRGSTLPLIAAFLALAAILILVVTAAGSLYVERKRLFTLADGASAAGAESFGLDQERPPGGGLPALDDREVRAAVDDYLRRAPDGSLDELRVVSAGSDDGRTARVSLSARWRPPVLTLALPEGVTIEVESTARSVLS